MTPTVLHALHSKPPRPISYPLDVPLPPLPSIADPALASQCLTHASVHQMPRTTNPLDPDQGVECLNYEKLEHVGDGILGGVITILLNDLWPNLSPGVATACKSRLVSNVTLADVCTSYGLPELIHAGHASLYSTRLQVKPRAAVFEAYISAVFLDFMRSDVPGEYAAAAQANGKASADAGSTTGDYQVLDLGEAPQVAASRSFNPTSHSTHRRFTAPPPTHPLHGGPLAPLPALQPRAKRTHGGALDYLERWLRPLFTPLASLALESLRADASALSPGTTATAPGATAALNGWAQKYLGKMPEYEFCPGDDGVGWRVKCAVVWGGREIVADETRVTKKAAQAAAAWFVCRQLGPLQGLEGVAVVAPEDLAASE